MQPRLASYLQSSCLPSAGKFMDVCHAGLNGSFSKRDKEAVPLLLEQITGQYIIFWSLRKHFTKHFFPFLTLSLLPIPIFIPNFSKSMIWGQKNNFWKAQARWKQCISSSARELKVKTQELNQQGLFLVLFLESMDLSEHVACPVGHTVTVGLGEEKLSFPIIGRDQEEGLLQWDQS